MFVEEFAFDPFVQSPPVRMLVHFVHLPSCALILVCSFSQTLHRTNRYVHKGGVAARPLDFRGLLVLVLAGARSEPR